MYSPKRPWSVKPDSPAGSVIGAVLATYSSAELGTFLSAALQTPLRYCVPKHPIRAHRRAQKAPPPKPKAPISRRCRHDVDTMQTDAETGGDTPVRA